VRFIADYFSLLTLLTLPHYALSYNQIAGTPLLPYALSSSRALTIDPHHNLLRSVISDVNWGYLLTIDLSIPAIASCFIAADYPIRHQYGLHRVEGDTLYDEQGNRKQQRARVDEA
jgi:hypothetical protein